METTLGIPNVFYDELMPEMKTLGEIKVTMFIILQTICLSSDEIALSQQDFMTATNLTNTTICKAIQDGLERGILLRRFSEGKYFYRTNMPGMPHFDLTPYKASYPGKVYLLKGDRWYKIGKSRDFDNRAKLFHLTLPFPVEVIHTIETGDCTALESYFHKLFADKRTNGEWFLLSDENVATIKNFETV